MYCGAIGITDKFDWFMCFVVHTNTLGCESGDMYVDAVKVVYKPFYVWNNLKSFGTDGCHYMISTGLYAGIYAHGESGESFIAYLNRDIAPKSIFAFHSVLHIISLSVGNCLKYVSPFWLKHIRLIYTYFARSAKRKYHLQQCSKNAMESLDDLVQKFGNI